LRAHPTLFNIPIIMFTAKAQIDEKWAGFQAGADDYLIKPTLPTELTARIRTLLPRVPAGESAAPPAAVPSPVELTTLPPTPPTPQAPKKKGQTADFSPSDTSLAQGYLIGITAARGGAGATTLAINLSASLTQQGYPTTLIDMDMIQGHVAMYLNQKAKSHLNDLVGLSGSDLQEAIHHSLITLEPKWRLLLSRPNLDHHFRLLVPDQVTTLLKTVLRPGHCVVVDMGRGLDSNSTSIIQKADTILICLQPDRVGMWAAQVLLRRLQNHIGPEKSLHAVMMDFVDGMRLPTNTVAEFLHYPLLATICLNRRELAQTVNRGHVLVRSQPNSQATAEFTNLAVKLLNEKKERA
jgi:Flp pilus assembly CpaE family ATPase